MDPTATIIGFIIGLIFSFIIWVIQVLLYIPVFILQLIMGVVNAIGLGRTLVILGIVGLLTFGATQLNSLPDDWQFDPEIDINLEDAASGVRDWVDTQISRLTVQDYVITSEQRVNGRSCPQQSCPVVTTFAPGDTISVVAETDGEALWGSTTWLEVVYDNGNVYVHSALADPTGEVEVVEQDRETSPYTIANVGGANGRVCPAVSDRCTPIVSFQRGEVVLVAGTVLGDSVAGSTDWLEVDIGGPSVYVHSSLAVPQGTPTNVQIIVETKLRNGPSRGYAFFGNASPGDTVDVIGTNATQTWLQIQHDSSGSGTAWVCTIHTGIDDAVFVQETEYSDYLCNETHIGADGVLTGVPPEQASLIFVNGIQTDYEDHRRALGEIRDHFGQSDVAGVYNETDALDLDVIQAVQDILQGITGERIRAFGRNIAVSVLVREVKDHFDRSENNLTLVGHSQGTAILSAALHVLAHDADFGHLTNLRVYTFANVAIRYPSGPTYRHCIHRGDTISQFPIMHQAFQNLNRFLPNTIIEVIPGPDRFIDIPIGDSDFFLFDANNHSLAEYLEDYTAERCPH